MSGYSDDYKDYQRAEFLRRWVPEDVPSPTKEQYRYTLARARAAEAELEDLKHSLATFKRILK